ncbi:hypothetical protein BGZ94_008519 [Podila epigama]|nr:hypothetical protein BGZ94_008519 [Podila epigama]
MSINDIVKEKSDGPDPLRTAHTAKTEGHLNQNCSDRLSRTCNACNTPGHISAQCSRFGERDREAARRKAKKEASQAAILNPPATTTKLDTTDTPPTTTSPTTQPTDPTTSFPHHLSDQDMESWDEENTPDENEETDQESDEDAPALQDTDLPMEENYATTEHQPTLIEATLRPISPQPTSTQNKIPTTINDTKHPIENAQIKQTSLATSSHTAIGNTQTNNSDPTRILRSKR